MNQLRRERIGKYIQEKGAVTVKEVSALFPDVSLMTIHRDLEKLEELRAAALRFQAACIAAKERQEDAAAQLEATGPVIAGSASQARNTWRARPSRMALRDCFTPITFSCEASSVITGNSS